MTPGKVASQASHAAVQTSLACLDKDPERFRDYQGGEFGTKVCLAAPHETKLRELWQLAKERSIPCAIIEDIGHKAFFNGEPVITALGIGPIRKEELPELKRLSLVK
jgi:peptidyl-tRNA hydrolase